MQLFKLKNIQFDAILQDIKQFLSKSIGGNTNIGQSSVFGQLLTVISAVAHNIMAYIEDALVEQNKYTAQRKKSIYGLAAQSGYQPSTGRAAGVWLQIASKPANETGLDVVVFDRARLICTQNGLYYVAVLNSPSITLSSDNATGTQYIYAVQGRMETQRFVSTGGNLYAQNIPYVGYIDTQYLKVYINGELWEQSASLYDMTPDSKEYYIRFNPVTGLDIVFGNDVHGRPLQQNDVIEVTYLLHDGEGGNLEVDDNTYFIFADTLTDTSGEHVNANGIFRISFATKDSVASGSNSESTAVTKQMIGFNSRALVLADSNNFRNFLSKYSFVGYNRTWSEKGSMVINSMVMQNHKLHMSRGSDYFKLTDQDFLLTPLQKASIKNALERSGQLLAGCTFNMVDIDLAKYALYVYVKLADANISHEYISTQIKQYVGEFMSNTSSDSYIPKSDIIKVIKDNISGIDGINVYIISEDNEKAIMNGEYIDKTYRYNPSTGTYATKETRIKVYPGDNPSLGLDAHGNILVDKDNQFPVFMGGWQWKTEDGSIVTTEPITIIYEN
uniref:Baseplate wedge protein n=1 Tax=Myoviridae sp. ct0f722 TaxID=2827599 RepID=A0A8S5LPT7_9CAUD|nr:MAG TPA: baseplate wedge protein [Myoviridae sp. ct0f722]